MGCTDTNNALRRFRQGGTEFIVQNDSVFYDVKITKDGEPYTDTAGWTLYFTAKREADVSKSDPTDALAIAKDEQDVVLGECTICFTITETGEFFADLMAVDEHGNRQTYHQFLIVVSQEVTQR